MPLSVVELVLRLLVLLLESTPIEQRRASMTAWFYMWWPLGKTLLKPEHAAAVELALKETRPRGE